MNKKQRKIIELTVLLLCILLIQFIRHFPAAGEFYAQHIYPLIASFLSAFSSLFPFSIGDCFLFIASAGILGYFIKTLWKKGKRKRRLGNIALFLGWIYVWFYFAWGLNYFRENYYARTTISPATYTAEDFKRFLADYITRLNAGYEPAQFLPPSVVSEEIRKGYTNWKDTFKLTTPPSVLKPKTMLFSSLFSKVGVSGYMGPFFTEFNLNGELRPEEYPSVFAHEAAHRLGVSSEAEANFYAWLICTQSEIPQIRHSGNFMVMGHILGNAFRLLPPEEYRHFLSTIRPEILEQYKSRQEYWQQKYSPGIGKIQNYIYNLFLKSNRISSGLKNYSEVVGLLLSWQRYSSLNKPTISPKTADKESISGNKISAPAS